MDAIFGRREGAPSTPLCLLTGGLLLAWIGRSHRRLGSVGLWVITDPIPFGPAWQAVAR